MENKTVDWVAWHSPYSDPQSPLSRRLAIVQTHIRSRLLAQHDSPIRVLSLCAGQGRDLLDVLEDLPQQKEIKALLIEGDSRNVDVAAARVKQLGLANASVLCADAGNSTSYVGAIPADLVIVCGVFGNITDQDIFRTIAFLPQLCTSSATVIWTRSRRPPDITPEIRQSFAAHGFREESFIAPAGDLFSVGVNTFEGIPESLTLGTQLFTFQ